MQRSKERIGRVGRPRRARARNRVAGAVVLAWVCLLCGLLLVPGGCGAYEGGAGGSTLSLVGGTLRPNPIAYSLTPGSDSAVGGEEGDDPLPSIVDLRRDGTIPPVQNQRWNSCVAWTLGYYLMTAVEARLQRLLHPATDFNVGDPINWFAPDFIYSQRDDLEERKRLAPNEPICIEADGELGCMRPEQALNVLVTKGCCRWEWMCGDGMTESFRSCSPDDTSTVVRKSRRVWGPASVDALQYRPRCYVRFGALDKLPRETIEDMRTWLAVQRTPIAIVVRMRTGWVNYRGENRFKLDIQSGFAGDLIEERGVCLEASESDLGSQHMMTIVGYDDEFPTDEDIPDLPEAKRGSFLVVNQWGEKWGDRGTMWIPYAELAEIWIGGYGILGRDGQASTARGIECAQDDQGRWVNIVECDDVPENLDPSGVRMPTANMLTFAPGPMPGDMTATHAQRVGFQEIPSGPCVPTSGGTLAAGRDFADWFAFSVPQAEMRLVVALTGPGGGNLGGDLDLRLIDEEGRHVASSLGTGTAPITLTQPLCQQGAFRLKVFPKGPNDQSDYVLTVTLSPLQPAEANDEICGAGALTLGVQVGDADLTLDVHTGAANYAADVDPVDWWRFTPTEDVAANLVLIGHHGSVIVRRGETVDASSIVSFLGELPHVVTPSGVVQPNYQAVPLAAALDVGESLWIGVMDSQASVGANLGGTFFGSTVPLRYVLVLVGAAVARDDFDTGATEVELAITPTETWVAERDPDSVGGQDQADWYVVTVPDASRLTVTAEGAGVASDLLLAFFGGVPQGQSTPDADTRVAVVDNLPGDGTKDIYLKATSASQMTVAYELSFLVELDDSHDDLRGATNVNVIAPGQIKRNLLGSGDTVDWFRYDPMGTAPPILLWLADWKAEGPVPTLRMVAEPGGEVALSDQSSTSILVRRLGLVPPGSTAVWIGVETPATAPLTDYTLGMTLVPTTDVPVDDNNTPPKAETLADGVPRPEHVDADDPQDFFRFPVPASAAGPVPVTITIAQVEAGKAVTVTAWVGAGTQHPTAGQPATAGPLAFTAPPGAEVTILVDGATNGGGYRITATTGP